MRHAREKSGKSVEQIAEETRIPQRHLESIEAGRFADLPSRTYAIGFSRTYARALGLDEHEILDMVRTDIADGGGQEQRAVSTFEPGDPARIPGRGLAWFSAFAALLLVVGVLAFFGDRSTDERVDAAASIVNAMSAEVSIMARCTGKTDVRNIEPEDLRAISLASSKVFGIPLAGAKRGTVIEAAE